MIHTVHIDDSTNNGKRLVQEMRKNNEGIVFEEKDKVAEAPAGYMTSEEFRKETKKDLNHLCNKYGLL